LSPRQTPPSATPEPSRAYPTFRIFCPASIYAGLSPRVRPLDAAQDSQIAGRLADLHAFVAGIYEKEQDGKRYTPEEADLLGADAQDRATAVAGQIAQLAARLGVPIQQ
jgi:hypothetical protein